MIRFRYLLPNLPSGWDLAGEPGLEQLVCLQNIVDEDVAAEILGW